MNSTWPLIELLKQSTSQVKQISKVKKKKCKQYWITLKLSTSLRKVSNIGKWAYALSILGRLECSVKNMVMPIGFSVRRYTCWRKNVIRKDTITKQKSQMTYLYSSLAGSFSKQEQRLLLLSLLSLTKCSWSHQTLSRSGGYCFKWIKTKNKQKN